MEPQGEKDLVCREFMKVRDVIRILHADGWVLVAIRGSHRQFKHPLKPGRVNVPSKPADDLARGTLKSVFKQADLKPGDWYALRSRD